MGKIGSAGEKAANGDGQVTVEPPGGSGSDPFARHDPYAVLRNRDLLTYLIAAMLGTIGNEMQVVAVGWELYDRTGSALDLGLVGLVQAAPVLLLVLPAGQLADRISRRHIIIAAQLMLVIASIGLAVVSAWRAPVGMVYACLGLVGVANAFAMPARWAFVPQLVPIHQLPSAVTWRSSTWQVAAVTGPALGGWALAGFGWGAPVYLLDAALGVVVVGLLATIAPRPVVRSGDPVSLGSMLAGVRFVAGSDLLLAALTLDLFAVLLGGAVALLPVYARDILRVGPTGLGWLRAAPSFGALATAVFIAHRPPLRNAGRALLGAVAGFGVATIVFGVSHSFALSLVMLVLTGGLDMVSVVVRSTLVQVLTPDAMRGRVSAVNAVFVGMSNELGAFESGLAARLLGPIPAVVAGGVGCLVVVAAVAVRWPRLARLDSLARLARPA
jgi:MFS family permease